MKQFIFSKETGRRGRNGSCVLSFSVYQIKKNRPEYVGPTEASSGSYRGDKSHVMNFLIEKGKIAKKHEGYYQYSNGEFLITHI